MKVIEVANISKRYSLEATTIKAIISGSRNHNHKFWALRDVSFDVERGEVFGIVGSNGSGKSTLLSILAGITNPTEGRVVIHGNCCPVLQVGVGFNAEFTGRENLFLSGQLIGIRAKELKRDFDDIVAFSDLSKFLNTPVKHYSAGMQTRLALTLAMQLEAEIMLIDEVLAAGDQGFQGRCMDRIYKLCNSGKTLVLVSHGLKTVDELCNRVMWLEKGIVRAIGPTKDVLEQYRQFYA